jgi:hypothetical protein
MGYIKQILVIVDPTSAEHAAVEKAALLAKKFNARLELFVCDTKAAREMRCQPISKVSSKLWPRRCVPEAWMLRPRPRAPIRCTLD